MNSRKFHASYLAEEDELNERAYIKMYRLQIMDTAMYTVLQVSMLLACLQCCLATIYRYQLFS